MVKDIEKERLKDLRKLRQILKLVPTDRKFVGEKLIAELHFMDATLAALRATVTEKGVVEDFEQGKQKFMRESPALKAYNTTIQRYSLLYKQLCDLLPKPEATDKSKDELIEHLRNIGSI